MTAGRAGPDRWSPTPLRIGGFLLLGGLETALLCGLGWGDPRFPFPGLALFAGAWAVWVLAAAGASGAGGPSGAAVDPSRTPGSEGAGGRGRLRLVWAVGIAMRLALLPLAPRLSDDIYRYLWDGEVQRAGINPYLFPPSAPELAGLRTGWHALINNPDVPTIYPPAAQMVFLGIALTGGGLFLAKAVWVLFDLAAAWLLVRVARGRGHDPVRVAVLYLWCPLLVVETAWSGHLEALGLFALALVLRFAGRERPADAGAALGLATLVKLAPLAAAPAIVARHGSRAAFGMVVVLAVGYAPYLAAGGRLWQGLRTYAEHWHFNAGAFVVVEQVVGVPRARIAAAGLVALVVLWCSVRRFPADRALFWILGAGVALSPTVHPWYVLWLLPFAALRPEPAWIWLLGAAALGYWGVDVYQGTGAWPEPAPVRLLVWVPFYALLAGAALSRLRAPPPRPAPT